MIEPQELVEEEAVVDVSTEEAPRRSRWLTLRIRPDKDGNLTGPAGYQYGPAHPSIDPAWDKTNIVFQDGFSFVPEDHPLLERMMLESPFVEIVENTPAERIYVCDTCDGEIKGGRRKFDAHRAAHRREEASRVNTA